MWPSPREVLPTGDLEAACVEILMASPLLVGLIPTANITTDLVGVELPWIQISREGGPQRFPLDYPRIDLNVFAERRSIAFDIASIARAELFASPGYRGHGLVILAAQEEVGLVRSTDKDSTFDRYFGSIRFTTRAISTDES